MLYWREVNIVGKEMRKAFKEVAAMRADFWRSLAKDVSRWYRSPQRD